ncbi:MAG: hypothetical protein U9R32_06965 [Bacteroidota bacterium]|nr:hypothetical protein [Bacteroidota bacterium]
MLKNFDPIKELMKHHEVEKAPDDFSMKLMGMIDANVVPEEDEKPIYSVGVLYGLAAFILMIISVSLFTDFSILGFDFNLNNIQITIFDNFSEYIKPAFVSVKSIFVALTASSLPIIVIVVVSILLLLDSILKKKITVVGCF